MELTPIWSPWRRLASSINFHMAVLLGSGCSQSFLGILFISIFVGLCGVSWPLTISCVSALEISV